VAEPRNALVVPRLVTLADVELVLWARWERRSTVPKQARYHPRTSWWPLHGEPRVLGPEVSRLSGDCVPDRRIRSSHQSFVTDCVDIVSEW